MPKPTAKDRTDVVNADGEIFSVEVLDRAGVWIVHTRIDYPTQRSRPYVLTHAPSGAAVTAGSRGKMRAIMRKLPQFGETWVLGKIDKDALAEHLPAIKALVSAEAYGTEVKA